MVDRVACSAGYNPGDTSPRRLNATPHVAGPEISFPILPSQAQQMPPDGQVVSRLVPVCLKVAPTACEPVLLEALRLWHRQDIFRLRFRKESGQWRQYYQAESAGERVSPCDFPIGAAEGSAEFLQEVMRACRQLMPAINIFTGPCSHLALLRRHESITNILWLVDHLLVDNASLTLLIRSLCTIYRTLLAGREVAIPPDQVVCHWAEHLARRARDPVVQQERAFWEMQLSPAGDLEARQEFTAVPRPAVRHATGTLDKCEAQRLLSRVARERTSFEELCLASFLRAYRDATGETDVLLCMASSGREALVPGIDLSRGLGCFSLFYPARFQLPACTAEGEFLRSIRQQRQQFSGRKENYALLRSGDGGFAERLRQTRVWEPAVTFNCLGSRTSLATNEQAVVTLSPEWRAVVGAFARDQDQAGTHHSPGSPRRGITFVILEESILISLLFYEDDPQQGELLSVAQMTRQWLSGSAASGR